MMTRYVIFLLSLEVCDGDMEEWYNEEWALYAEGIHAYIKTIDLKFADTFKYFIDEYYEERNKENRGE